MKRIVLGLVAGLTAVAATAADLPPGDAKRGETLYAACIACHALDPTQNQLGPHLKGVLGRKAAAVEDYVYSPPMRRSEVVWTPDVLDAFLADPQSVVPGSKMPFAGMADPQERADIVAYLRASGGS